MDLHDFTDVAINYDNYLKELNKYHVENFENFYLSLAEKYGKENVLDIACGTGALTVPLVKAGYEVTAFDRSVPMTEVTKKKLLEEGLDADVFAADMKDFKLERKYSFAIIARSGFMHLLTAEDQRKTLLNIHAHLSGGGGADFK